MKKGMLVVLIFIAQLVYAQENWAIVDGRTYSKIEFDSLRTILKEKPVGIKRMSMTEWSERAEMCLCVEFYRLTVTGVNLHRDCGDLTKVVSYSDSGIIYVTRDNGTITEYQVFDPGNNTPVNDVTDKVLIFEIKCSTFSQGLKHWTNYPNGDAINIK